MKTLGFLTAFISVGVLSGTYAAAEPSSEPSPGDKMLQEYLEKETRRIESAALEGLKSKEDWEAWKTSRRGELFSMLGLDPERERTDLNPVVTGTGERDGIVVENLHFQSSPGLYVTGNLYRPKVVKGKLPTVLYVCGHGGVKKDGVSFGNKVHYHHHGAWFARNGYVCLVIDTLQLGEIEGMHHGTYRYGRWDWICRGYSPAAVEAWNGMRALDYLETRKEVDAERFGVTGRSGGGAYSWYLAALDDRIKVAVPVAGITSLKDHVVGRCVDGHCDCMYMVNSARWDFSHLSALVAPRPLLIQNTDKDRIFPLGGVVDVYNKTRGVYRLLDAEANIGLCITEGGHKDTQELRVPAFRWFERFLKGIDPPPAITDQAVPVFDPEELKVFKELPEDEVNTEIGDRFTELAGEPVVPEDEKAFWKWRREKIEKLRAETFGGWPKEGEVGVGLATDLAFDVKRDGVRLRAIDFDTQGSFRLRLFLAHRAGLDLKDLDFVVLNVMDARSWGEFQVTFGVPFRDQLALPDGFEVDGDAFAGTKKLFANFKWGMAYVAPRGIGSTAWVASEKRENQVRRSFVLIGQTVEGMRVWDVRRSVRALRGIEGAGELPLLGIQSSRSMAGVTLYASLFEDDIVRLDLHQPPRSHKAGTTLLNVLRIWDLPEAMAAAGAWSKVVVYDDDKEAWQFPIAVGEKLGWDKGRIQIRNVMKEE